MKKISLLLMAIFAINVNAQTLTFEKHYGGNDIDYLLSGDKTSDGGYIMAGYTQSFGIGNTDFYMVRTTANGDTLWTKTFGTPLEEIGFSVAQTNDGGFIMTGFTITTERFSDIYLVKTDSNGNLEWSTAIGGLGYDIGYSVQQASDGGYIIAGATESFGAGSYDAYLIKTDDLGNISWTKTFGYESDERMFSVIETSDGGYALAGLTRTSDGSADAYLIKTSNNGNFIWSKIMGEAAIDDFGYCVRETSDNNFALLGYTQSFGSGDMNVFLTKTDSDGNTILNKLYSAPGDQFAFSIEETSDNGLIVAGANAQDFFFFKTDNNFDIMWAKSRIGNFDDGAYYATETTNGKFAIMGYTQAEGFETPAGYNFNLICTDSVGNTGCNDGNVLLTTSMVTFAQSLNTSFSPNTGGTADPVLTVVKMGTTIFNVCPGISEESIIGADLVCANTIGTPYFINDTLATAFTWTSSSGIIITSGQGTDSITVDTDSLFYSGTISVTVTGPNGTYVSYKNISSITATPGSISGNNFGLCSVQESYTIASIPGAISYTWTAPAGATISSGQGTEIVIIDFDSTFTGGNLTVSTISICGASAEQALSLFPYPLSVSQITGPTEGLCASGISTTTFFATPVIGATSYTWIVPPGITIVAGQGTDSLNVIIDSAFVSGALSVSANNACGSSDSTQITLNSIPTVYQIIGASNELCPLGTSTTSYFADPSSPFNTYTWVAPAGATIVDGQGTPTVTVTFDSTFTTGDISVTTSNACGTGNQISLSLASIPVQQGAILGPNSGLCVSTVYAYDLDSTTSNTPYAAYNWTVPAGTTIVSGQGSQHLEIMFDNTCVGGTLSVQAANACGFTTPTTLNLAAPTLLFAPTTIFGPKAGLCAAGITNATYYVNPDSTATGYTWTVPSGITLLSGQGTDSIQVSVDSSFVSGTLSVHSFNSCGNSSEKTALLKSISNKPGAITGPKTELCVLGNAFAGYTINPVAGATSYTWTAPTGATILFGQGTDTITVVFDSTFTSGTLSVVSNNACGSSAPRNTTLRSVPVKPGSITGPKIEVCSGWNPAGHYSILPVDGATSYTWTAPTGATIYSGQGTDSINVFFDTTFTSGNLTVVANNACGSSPVRSVLLRSVPATPGAISGTKVGLCTSGISTTTYSVPTVGSISSYTWTAPSGATIVNGQGTTTVDIVFDSTFVSGNLTVFASNACGNSNVRSTLLRSVTATPGVITGPTGACANETGLSFSINPVTGATGYTWTVPSTASITSGQGTDSITVDWGTTAGNITVVATNDCGNSGTRSKHINLLSCSHSMITGIAGTEKQPTLHVYPNPNNGLFTFVVNQIEEQVVFVKITNVLGETIYSNELAADTEKQINLTEHAKGIYMVQLTAGGNNYYQKIIIQ